MMLAIAEDEDYDARRRAPSPQRWWSVVAAVFAAAACVAAGAVAATTAAQLDAVKRESDKAVADLRRQLRETRDALDATSTAFSDFARDHAIKITNEALERDVQGALETLKTTTVQSEARTNATARALERYVVAAEASLENRTTRAVAETLSAHDAAVAARVAAFNASLSKSERRAAAAVDAEALEGVEGVEGAAADAVALVKTTLDSSNFAIAEAVASAADLRNASRDADATAIRVAAAAEDAINRTAAAALKNLALEERRHEAALAASTHDLEMAAQSINDRVSASEEEVRRNEGRNDRRFARQNTLLRAWISGFFAICAVVLTLRHVYAHLTRMAQPDAQRKVLAILWMVPIYASCSWAAIVWPSAEREVLLLSSVYEAYCVHMFFSFLVAVLGAGEGEEAALDELPEKLEAPFAPFGMVTVTSDRFLHHCKLGTLQFVVCKPILSALDYAFSYTSLGGGALLDYSKPALWIILLLNLSVSIALTALLKFFHATHLSPRLRARRPWPKFLAIKGVVFMTWFQGVAIQLAVRFDAGPLADRATAIEFQNFLVCVEMFVAALAHTHIFGADEWQPDYVPVHLTASVADNLAINDFVKDFRSVLPRRLRRTRPAKLPARPSEDDLEEAKAPSVEEAAAANPLHSPSSETELVVRSLLDEPERSLLDVSEPESPEPP